MPRELVHLPEVRWLFRALRAVAFVAFIVTLPFFLDLRSTNLAAAVLIYAIIAISLVLLTGWAGEISLGQVAFVAIGSAAAGAANVHWDLGPVACILLAGVVGAVVSVVIGVPALRIRGLFLDVTTLTFAVATSSYLLNRRYVGFLPDVLIDRVQRGELWTPFGNVDINSERGFYFVCAAGLGAVIVAIRGLEPYACEARCRRLAGQRAQRAGIRAEPGARRDLLAFALSGFFASFTGGLLVLHQQALGRQIFAPVESLRALHDGRGRRARIGPRQAILGAVSVKSTESLNVIVPVRFRYLFTFAGSGIGLLLVLWLLPGGFGSVLYGGRAGHRELGSSPGGCRILVPSLVTEPGGDGPVVGGVPRRGSVSGRAASRLGPAEPWDAVGFAWPLSRCANDAQPPIGQLVARARAGALRREPGCTQGARPWLCWARTAPGNRRLYG